jgi:nucleoside phosphorylase
MTTQKAQTGHTPSLAIVIPTSFELAPFLRLWPELRQTSDQPWETYQLSTDKVTVNIIVSYIGPANAAAATERIIVTHQGVHRVEAILHCGAAGAIKPSLMPGDIVLGSEVKTICSKEILAVRKSLLLSASAIRYLKGGKPVHVDSLAGAPNLLAAAATCGADICAEKSPWSGPGWPDSIPKRPSQISLGCLGSQDGWTKSAEELDFIATTFGVDTEDMESAYVAQIAAKHEIPFLAVRVISNNERIATLAKNEILPAVELAAERAALLISKLVEQYDQL